MKPAIPTIRDRARGKISKTHLPGNSIIVFPFFSLLSWKTMDFMMLFSQHALALLNTAFFKTCTARLAEDWFDGAYPLALGCLRSALGCLRSVACTARLAEERVARSPTRPSRWRKCRFQGRPALSQTRQLSL
jgi:hypothetical protein